MKLNSPFLCLVLSVLLFSCTGNNSSSNKESSSETAINNELNKLLADTLPADKREDVEKQLSRQSSNATLPYKSVLHKMDSVIAVSDPDSIPVYWDRFLKMAPMTEKQYAFTAYILRRKAEHAYALKHYQQSFTFYNQSKEVFEKEHDSLKIGYNLVKMAQIQQIFNDYSGSEETLTDALVFLEKSKEANEYIREAINMLGIAYTGLKDYNQAIKYYSQAKKITDHPISQKIIENNIALCYLEEKKYDQAIAMFKTLYATDIVKKDTLTLAKVADNLGISKFRKDGSSGRELMEEALEIRTGQADKKGMVYSYLNLADFYASKNPALTADYAQKAHAMATEIGAIDRRLQALQLLATYGDKRYNQEYFRLNDSVDDFRQRIKNHFAKMRFDTEKERRKSLAKEVSQAKERIRNLIIGFILVGLIISIIVVYFMDRKKHKREKQQQKQEDEYRTEIRIAKKLHDELANDVFNTMTFAEIRDLATPGNKEILLDNLDKIYAQTRNISKENNNIDTGERYLDNLKEMLSGYGSDAINIIIKEIEGIDWLEIESSKKIVVHRVLQELLVNMKKHSKASVVLISFKKVDKKIQINYSDNGVGMGTDEHLRKNGLQNVENRIQSINGTITFDPTPEKGLKVNFAFNC